MANSVDPDQTAPIGAVCTWSTLFASILNSSVMLGNYLQQTTLADDIDFSDAFFSWCALRVFNSPWDAPIEALYTGTINFAYWVVFHAHAFQIHLFLKNSFRNAVSNSLDPNQA